MRKLLGLMGLLLVLGYPGAGGQRPVNRRVVNPYCSRGPLLVCVGGFQARHGSLPGRMTGAIALRRVI